MSRLACTSTELFSKPSLLHLLPQFPSHCCCCCGREMRSHSNQEEFLFPQRNRMISEDHVKQVHDTSMRQSITTTLPAVSPECTVGKINGFACVSNFSLPLPPLVCQTFIFPSPRSTSRFAMCICPSAGNYIKSCTTFERANTHS